MKRRAFLQSLPVLASVGGAGSGRTQENLSEKDFDRGRRPVPRQHLRLFRSRSYLTDLARKRPEAYRRMKQVAARRVKDDHSLMLSCALVFAVENNRSLGRRAVSRAMKYARGPIRKGHVPFGHDLARCGIVYDLCYDLWQPDERAGFHAYLNRTVDANRRSETHVFHNGWYGYKNWGVGIASYASYWENPQSPSFLRALEREYLTRAAPALRLAGAGGGWAEGYYIHYWLYEWLFFCEVARMCEGINYYAAAPSFYRNRPVASMFEMYPTVREYGSRRPIPMGDGGGRLFGGDRDKALSARRILVAFFGHDPEAQAVHAFNETTPRSSVGMYAYKDFLWHDREITQGDLGSFRLSHVSTGPGYVYARSSWEEEATFFFFKCGNRFTAHQHLDNGHFLIFKHEELAGDGGHYDAFGSLHDVNYHLRTIAHSTVLVYDPQERYPAIRAGPVRGNDGGQAHNWPHHNGAVSDPAQWYKDRRLYEIASLRAFEDRGSYLYVAGDCTRSYSEKKLALFTRQVVFLRPDTFVVFDRVRATSPAFRKTWVLQAMKVPEKQGPFLVVTHLKGRLFIQRLLPRKAQVHLASGATLYQYEGNTYPPRRDTGPAPECRLEVSAAGSASTHYFLFVLTAGSTETHSVPAARCTEGSEAVSVTLGAVEVTFLKRKLGGSLRIGDRRRELTQAIESPKSGR